MNATVRVDGDTIEHLVVEPVAVSTMKILRAWPSATTPDKVTVHTPFLGGGFGRRTDGDELVEALMLAQSDARPAGQDDLEPRGRHPATTSCGR